VAGKSTSPVSRVARTETTETTKTKGQRTTETRTSECRVQVQVSVTTGIGGSTYKLPAKREKNEGEQGVEEDDWIECNRGEEP
jgi:hypothetical protein